MTLHLVVVESFIILTSKKSTEKYADIMTTILNRRLTEYNKEQTKYNYPVGIRQDSHIDRYTCLKSILTGDRDSLYIRSFILVYLHFLFIC